MFICMCEMIWYSMRSSEYWSVVDIPISLGKYFWWLYVLPCLLLSLSVHGEMSEAVQAQKSESCPTGSQNVREWAIERVEYI